MPVKNVKEIKEVARLIKEKYDKIPNENKTKKDAEIVQAALNTCFRNAIGLDATIVDDHMLNDDNLSKVEGQILSETSSVKEEVTLHEGVEVSPVVEALDEEKPIDSENNSDSSDAIVNIPERQVSNENDQASTDAAASTEECRLSGEEDCALTTDSLLKENEEIAQFCSALTIEDSEEESLELQADVSSDSESLKKYVTELLLNPHTPLSKARIDAIKASRHALDLDSPTKLSDYSLIETIAEWLTEVTKSKFELSEKNLANAFLYEKEVKKICDMLTDSKISFNSMTFKEKEMVDEEESGRIKNIYQEAREAVNGFVFEFLPGYDDSKQFKEKGPEQASNSSNLYCAPSSSGSSRKTLKFE